MAHFQTDNLRIEKSSEDAAVLRLDVAGRNVNVFNRDVLGDFAQALDHLGQDRRLRFLGIRSANPSKPIAGADLHDLTAIAGPEEATALSALGQRLFDQLANLRVPTVMVINGPCLGGGLELALACDYRVVIDQPKTVLGLPEIELGLLPGWGGTQRLPRVIGLERALQLILGGRRLDAREALRWGLADAVASNEPDLAATLTRIQEQARRQGKRPRKNLPLRTWRQRLLESTWLGRALLFRGAERILRRKVPDDMPAPGEALRAIRVGVTDGMAAGLAYERAAIGRLATTPACRNLVHLFLQREQARKPEATESAAEIRRVGLVGAGTMGAGIAQLAAVRGFEVVIQEVNDAALAAGLQKIEDLFGKAVQRRLLSADEASSKRAAIRSTTTWEGFGEVDLVVEAVLEELGVKRAVFRDLERHTRPTTILATNTSSLSVTALQEGLRHPERVAAVHFFNPVHKMPLIEVAQTPTTDQRTLTTLTRWAIALGKTPVVVGDSPGFLVNRILMPYLNEAVQLVAEGMAVEQVDAVMRRFGMPMGPLELLDQVGLDVAAHIARAMRPRMGNRFPPSPALEQMSDRGWLGQKSGTGFYRYEGRRNKVHEAALDVLRTEGYHDLPSLPEARDRMVLLMCNEAAACLGEAIAASAEVIDLAMVLGTGWAPHRGGPLRYAADRGLEEVVQTLAGLAQRLGPRFEPHPVLRHRATLADALADEIATGPKRY
ncbi:MAG: 3-hydroxyacyl-CoA dehydrogenase NAD-binding domain-containing protein [Gemmataceae bacterium]|nr:3-hydroxyacyl-CoA dehydrogenase NAD-binding domain-containing protein [Gemmataceae bacterium]